MRYVLLPLLLISMSCGTGIIPSPVPGPETFLPAVSACVGVAEADGGGNTPSPSPTPGGDVCGACGGDGIVGDGTIQQTCKVCGGTGRVTTDMTEVEEDDQGDAVPSNQSEPASSPETDRLAILEGRMTTLTNRVNLLERKRDACVDKIKELIVENGELRDRMETLSAQTKENSDGYLRQRESLSTMREAAEKFYEEYRAWHKCMWPEQYENPIIDESGPGQREQTVPSGNPSFMNRSGT